MNNGQLGLRRSMALAVAAGLLLTAYFPLIRMGLFVQSPVGLAWPVLVSAALLSITVWGVRRLRPWTTLTVPFAVIGGVVVGAVVILNALPPVQRDELVYHLAFPAYYIQAGRAVEIPFSKYSYYPMLVQLAYLPLVAQGWVQATKYLHFAFGLATVSMLYMYMRTRVTAAVAFIVAMLLLTTPTFAILMAGARVDLALVFYTVVMFIALSSWSQSGLRRDLILAGLAAGFAASVKYNGFLVVALATSIVPFFSPRRAFVPQVHAATLFLSCSLLPVCPWLVKNFLETGNPFFPLLNSILGERPLAEVPLVDPITRRRLLFGESWLEIALAPVRVFFAGRVEDLARFDGVFNPIYFLAVAAPFRKGASARDVALLGFGVAFLFLVLFLDRYESRYVLPALVPLAILTAETLTRWWARSRGARLGIVALALACSIFNLTHFAQFWSKVDPLPYVIGRQSKAQYISRFVPEYPLTVYANEHLPEDHNVYLAFLGSRGFYWKRPYSYDDNYLAPTLSEAVRDARTPGAIAARLREQGIDSIAANRRLLSRYMRDNLTPEERARWKAFVRDELRILYQDRHAVLYEVRGGE